MSANAVRCVRMCVCICAPYAAPSVPTNIHLSQLEEGVRVVFALPAMPNGVILGYTAILIQVGSTVEFNSTVSASARWVDFNNLFNESYQYSARVRTRGCCSCNDA